MGCNQSHVQDLRTSEVDYTSNPWPFLDEQGYYASHYKDGKWVNWWSRHKPSVFTLGATFMASKDESGIHDMEAVKRNLPIEQPYWLKEGSEKRVGAPGVRATWIGHATVLAEVDGSLILCDPIFSERASMFQWIGPKRYRPPACTIDQLPDNIDGVVISHTHYDHMDYNSIVQIHKRYPGIQWFVPSGTKAWFGSSGLSDEHVHEMEWWQEVKLNGGATIAFTPSNHWSRRKIADENKSLWGSWTVLGNKGGRFWFGGDTAYSDVFKQIGKRYGPFNLSAIPIGAYNPRSIMKYVHVNPDESVKIHEDIQSLKSVGIHWGTFKLTYEPYLEPKQKIEELVEESGRGSNGEPLLKFQVVNIGGTVEGK